MNPCRWKFRPASLGLALLWLVVCGWNEAEGGVNVWTSGGPAAPLTGGGGHTIAIDPVAEQTLYVTSETFQTTGLVFKSTDGGASWSSGTQCSAGSAFALAIDPQTRSTLYLGVLGVVGSTGGICKSTDAGASWTPMIMGLPTTQTGNDFQIVVVDPQNPSTIYAGSGDARVFKSTDGAASWVAMTSGISSPGGSISALAINPLTPATVYAGTTTAGVYKTVNGGTSWSPLGPPGGALGGAGSNFIFDLAIDPQNPSTVYAAAMNGLFKSLDAGGSWAPIGAGITDTFMRAVVVDPHASSTLYAGTQHAGVFTSADGGATWVPMNNGLGRLAIQSLAISSSGTFLHAATQNGPEFDFQVGPNPCAPGQSPGVTSLVAAVLPSSRSVEVGTTATAFATVINAGGSIACGVGISLASAIPASFKFNTTSCATNAVTGADNAPVDVAAGASACYVVSITPTAAFGPTEVAFTFTGSNTTPAPTLTAIDTLLMSASTTAVPDIIALAATVTNDGIVHLPGPAGSAAFAVATSNLGITAAITVSANTGSAVLPLTVVLCQTDPITGLCISTPGPTVPTVINTGGTPTFGIFLTASGVIPLDPANSRIFVVFVDSNGVVRGRTSVAVTTQ